MTGKSIGLKSDVCPAPQHYATSKSNVTEALSRKRYLGRARVKADLETLEKSKDWKKGDYGFRNNRERTPRSR